MKIGIDISQIIHGTGVSFYTRNLVRSLARVDKKNEYLLLGYSLRQRGLLENFVNEIREINPHFTAKIISLPPQFMEPFGNRWRLIAVEKLFGLVDVFHSSDWIQFPTRAAKVTTLHDFGFLRFPQTASPKISQVMRKRLALVKAEVDFAIAVSRATAKDAQELLGIPAKKIRVVYEAPAEEHQTTTSSTVKKVKKKLEIEGKYLLSVANLDPRKNLKQIIEAFFLLREQGLKMNLVIVGKPGWSEMSHLGLGGWPATRPGEKGKVIFAGYVDNTWLTSLYSGASCLVYPSLLEGFGLPILGAMKFGCPVVTSKISSMPEVAGKAAVLVDPLKAEEIAAGIKKALEEKEKLVKRGYRQVKKFSWQKAAGQTLKVYGEAYQKSG